MNEIIRNCKKIIPHLAGVVLLRLLMDWQYAVIIYPNFASKGFINEISSGSSFFSWMYLLAFSPFFIAFLYKTEERFLSLVLYFLFLIKFIPATSLMAFLPVPFDFFASQAIFWIITLLLAFYLPPIRLKLNVPKFNKPLLYGITILLSAVVIYVWWFYANARFQTSIIDVYGARLEARNWEMPTLLNYLLFWARIILPLMLIWFLHHKKRVIALVLVAIIYLNFSIAGNKIIIFLMFITLIVYYLFREKYLKWILVALIGIVLLGFVEYLFLDSFYICSFSVRRLMYVPNLLDYCYFDFFSTFSPDYYQQSFLRYFGFESRYDVPISFLIGENYFDNPAINANNGLLSDAYSNFGFCGVFITPILVMYTLKFLSNAAQGIDMKILIVPIVYVCFLLMSTNLTTALLTGGILVLWLFLLLLPRQLNTSPHDNA